jgi:hyperosmotically inducible protein
LLPYYSVFDDLSYRVEGSKVILSGQVVRPSLKSDAEVAVKGVEGVSSVENDIEVLPPAPMDDQIRRAVSSKRTKGKDHATHKLFMVRIVLKCRL